MIRPQRVIGVGSPIVDRLAMVDEDFLAGIGGDKGGMELVDTFSMEALLGSVVGSMAVAPGGSAANTIFALARLKVPCALLGKIGDDAEGTYYRRAFEEFGGDCSRLKTCGLNATARCLSLITPDSERTMRTDLGAAAGLLPQEVSAKDFEACDHAHVEGYLLFNRELTKAVLEAAKTAGCTVSLDLGSFEVVRQAAGVLPDLLGEYVDVVMANQDEAAAFSGEDDPGVGLKALGKYCEVAAVKQGADGALIRLNGDTCFVPARPVDNAVDSTGAGDLWAAGFLYGYLRGYSADDCGHLGALLGAEAVRQVGANLPDESWENTLRYFDQYVKER